MQSFCVTIQEILLANPEIGFYCTSHSHGRTARQARIYWGQTVVWLGGGTVVSCAALVLSDAFPAVPDLLSDIFFRQGKDFLSDIKGESPQAATAGRYIPSSIAPNPPQTPHTAARLLRGAAYVLSQGSPSSITAMKGRVPPVCG